MNRILIPRYYDPELESDLDAAEKEEGVALAGHSTLTTTQRYMHLSPAAKGSAIALLNTRPTEPENEAGTTGAQERMNEKKLPRTGSL